MTEGQRQQALAYAQRVSEVAETFALVKGEKAGEVLRALFILAQLARIGGALPKREGEAFDALGAAMVGHVQELAGVSDALMDEALAAVDRLMDDLPNFERN
jgi:hypothetical protein